MQITYFANLRLPTEKAHGLQIIKTCEAFVRQGVNLKLVIPRRKQLHPQLAHVSDPFDYYQITTRFPIIKLPCLDLLSFYVKLPRAVSHWPYYLQELTFDLSCLVWAILSSFNRYSPPFASSTRTSPTSIPSAPRAAKFTPIKNSHTLPQSTTFSYTRSFPLAVLLSLFHPRSVIFELHNLPPSPASQKLYSLFFPRLTVVTINKYLYSYCLKLKTYNLILAPDAASDEDFHLPSKAAARKKLRLPQRPTIILYTGSFDRIKGVYALAQASRYLQPSHHLYLLGGSPVDRQITPLREFIRRHQLKNIHLITQLIPHHQLPLYRAAADLLVIPNSATSPRSSLYTSPLKLFQYLASGRPIVASQVPAIREVVTDKHVFFFTPDHPRSLAYAINQALQHPQLAQTKSQSALKLAQKSTWSHRVRHILDSLNS
jgi:glycosyltransferase involved in cell wall biosynthesis